MPPHCDSMDGPVVKAAIKALETGNVNVILLYVHKEGEAEVLKAFEKVLPLRKFPAERRKSPTCISLKPWSASIGPVKALPLPA